MTEAQIKILRCMSEPGGGLRYITNDKTGKSRWYGGSFYSLGIHPVNKTSVEALRKSGHIVAILDGKGTPYGAHISDKGRTALQEIK